MAVLSHFIEKFKIGKRFVLLDFVVHPYSEQPWESAGPENKFLTGDAWQAVYRKLEEVCRKQFKEQSFGSSKDVIRLAIDKEYQYRLDERPNILLKYEFKDSNNRDNLNAIFNENEKKLHRECLHIQIVDETRDLFQELQEKKKTIDRLQKENEKLRTMPEPSQEYTPTPVKALNSSTDSILNHSEYIPTAINGDSPVSQTSYRASKIVPQKPVPDPYTPSSSQEIDTPKASYVPSTFTTPHKPTTGPAVDGPVLSANKSKGKRRIRHAEIFGHSDEESDAIKKTETDDGNQSVENIFSQDSPKAADLVGSSSDELPTGDNKRLLLPRKTKSNVQYKPTTPDPASNQKRRRKESEVVDEVSVKTSKTSSSSESKSAAWIKKNKTERESHDPQAKAKEKDNDKAKKIKSKKDLTSSFPIHVVDREKLREEDDRNRKRMADLQKLIERLPEDKTELDVPVWNCFKLSTAEIDTTFEKYRAELKTIYDRYKDQTERQWREAADLVYFTEVTSVLDEEQTYAMMKRLEAEFVPVADAGKYTEFFASTLIMEWGLRIWMKMYGFKDRRKALDRIRLQEEANPFDINGCTEMATVSNKKKR